MKNFYSPSLNIDNFNQRLKRQEPRHSLGEGGLLWRNFALLRWLKSHRALHLFTILLCFATTSHSMEEDILHALNKMKHLDKKTIADLEHIINQISIDLRNPPPQERFEISRTSERHICLWNCSISFQEVKWYAEDLHNLIEFSCDNQGIQRYLKEKPSLALFADKNGKTIFEKSQGRMNDETRILMQQVKENLAKIKLEKSKS